jgi:hypothetical protein
LAIVSAIALVVALGLAVLVSLQPWEASSVAPQLSVAPGLGVALGDSVAVSPGPRQLAIAPAQPAPGGKPGIVAKDVAGAPAPPQPRLAVAAARAVAALPRNGPSAVSPGPPPSGSPPAPLPPPAPVAVPVVAAAPPPAPGLVATSPTRVAAGGQSPPPIGAGVGPGEGGAPEAVEVHDGDESAFSFSFSVQPSAYRSPGVENLIVQFRGDGGEGPSFALQLWDDGSGVQRGLWSSGDAMGGERFLAPLEDGVWHEAALAFKASNDGEGFYVLLLDGQPVDARAWVSLIEPESSAAQIEVGLFREGERLVDAPDVAFGPTRLGDSLESVIP